MCAYISGPCMDLVFTFFIQNGGLLIEIIPFAILLVIAQIVSEN